MCVLSVAIADVWEIKLVEEAVMEPVVKGIVPAVLVAGMAFHYGQEAFQSFMSGVVKKMNLRALSYLSRSLSWDR